ncbi:lysozyme inhibitor LprI family protein [Achromobacter seleniivolatilans]|uniref:Lysozyme inhibitor LprI family protein n=1 Tax=Achromobacter seleniivolatilans TaxID=3047478 RepID=A0ABY9M1L8_9BURK|nr:lysozyme inhibitor LprI family protein [Achromobacter sp. R39]WMD20879.1 lysozyme inhibitor LprI family protein [Achromobacter sp. R39]
MHKLARLAFALGAIFPWVSIASADTLGRSERELRLECAFEPPGVRECLEKKAAGSEVELKDAEEKAVDVLSKWDEDAKYVNQAKAKLKASNRDFITYRDAQCAFASSLGGGAIGNALAMRRFACVAELNGRRALQLRDLVSDRPLK